LLAKALPNGTQLGQIKLRLPASSLARSHARSRRKGQPFGYSLCTSTTSIGLDQSHR